MNLAIFGSGIISSELATFLSKKKHHVTVAVQYPEKLHIFSKSVEKSIVLKDFEDDDLLPIIVNNHLLVVPLSSDTLEEATPVTFQIAHAIRRMALHGELMRRIVVMSSTAVYGDHNGLWVDETSSLKAETEEGKMLIDAERIFESLSEFGWNVCILRVAEIYGSNRELSKRLRSLNSPLPGSGFTYTNMIHRIDVISAIDYCIRHHLEGIYNLVDDEHPTREELYKEIIERDRLPPVEWDPSIAEWHRVNKRVSNHKIKAAGFSLKHAYRVREAL